MAVARQSAVVPLSAERAFALWTDLRRWPSFIDGFGRLDRADDSWPQPGAKIVWVSTPGGRGRVTERVEAHEPPDERPGRVATQVLEEALTGIQTVDVEGLSDEETKVVISLDYELARGGPLRKLADLLFIRRAQND